MQSGFDSSDHNQWQLDAILKLGDPGSGGSRSAGYALWLAINMPSNKSLNINSLWVWRRAGVSIGYGDVLF